MSENVTLSFGQQHFAAACLGDRRRTQRLVDVADRLRRRPAGSLPRDLQDPAAYRACCRLMNHPDVTHEAVLAPHRAATLQKMHACPGVVLILHDTTELDYSGHQATALGPIGNGGGRGYECHHSLAVAADDGQLFGLASQILHRRAVVPPGEGVAAKRARKDRESRLWLAGAEATGPAPEGTTWVDVADRGADTFEFLDFEHRQGRHYVVRSTHNRALEADSIDGPRLLHDRMRAEPTRASWTVAVTARPGRPRREAQVEATWVTLRVRAPQVRRGEHGGGALEVVAVRVWEPHPPAGVEPLEWLLLSDLPIADAADLRRRVGWYERRWLVEELHKAQKTGLGIEALQFRTMAALEPAIALLSVVAVALVSARELARDEATASRSASEVVDATTVRVLSVWRFGVARDLTIREFVLALGRLGGHQNRKGDGPPGWQTLWHGWNQLQAMVTYEMSRAKSGMS